MQFPEGCIFNRGGDPVEVRTASVSSKSAPAVGTSVAFHQIRKVFLPCMMIREIGWQSTNIGVLSFLIYVCSPSVLGPTALKQERFPEFTSALYSAFAKHHHRFISCHSKAKLRKSYQGCQQPVGCLGSSFRPSRELNIERG